MADTQEPSEHDLELLHGELTAIEQSRRVDLQSAGEEQFDAYRVAYAKAELLAEFCRTHPEVVARVGEEMVRLRPEASEKKKRKGKAKGK